MTGRSKVYKWLEKNKRRLVHAVAASGYGWYRICARFQRRHLREIYPERAERFPRLREGQDRCVIVCMDPRHGRSGGLTGRLDTIISIYYLCKVHGWRFGIWFRTPFVLEEYLLPNEYDWRVNERQFDAVHAAPVACYWISAHPRAMAYAERYIERWVEGHALSHLYGHLHLYPDGTYATLYHELFRPVPALEALVEQNRRAIGGEYVAAVFRFQQLLGDFVEGDYPTLDEGGRQALIGACLKQLADFRMEHPEVKKILVTSDSTTFLRAAAEAFEWVYTIPGEMVHLDYVAGADGALFMKSWVDFYMIGGAQQVCQIVGGQMYRSSFPEAAAAMGGIPYVEVKF